MNNFNIEQFLDLTGYDTENTILNIRDVDGNGYYDVNDFLKMNNKEILDMNNGKKFDICLQNPPYDNGLGDKFLSKVTNISNIICTIQPLTWLLGKKQNQNIINNISNNYVKIETLNDKNEKIFDADNPNIISIIYIDKLKNNKILINNNEYNSFSEINKLTLKNDKLLINFNKIVKNLYEKSNLLEYIKYSPNIKAHALEINKHIEKNPNKNWYVIRLTRYSKNYYILNNSSKPELFSEVGNKIIKNNKYYLEYYYAFNTKQSAQNFINYLNTYFCRTCLYNVQLDNQIINKNLKYIPWFDFSDEHFNKSSKKIDDYLFKKYNISDEIRNHIEEILPDYYGIRK